jgi:DNA-directed RNA polymerase
MDNTQHIHHQAPTFIAAHTAAAVLKSTEDHPREIAAAIAKLDDRQAKVALRQGWGATTGGLAITQKFLGTLSSAVAVSLSEARQAGSAEANMIKVVRGLDATTLGLCILQQALSTMAAGGNQTILSLMIGMRLQGECWAAGLIQSDAARAKSIAKRVKMRHSSSAARLMAAKREASQSYTLRNGDQVNAYEQREWPKTLAVRAGNWGLNVLTEALPEVFKWRTDTLNTSKGVETQRYLEITDEAWATVDTVMRDSVMQRPVWFPSLTLPKPWDAWSGCGSNDPRINSVTKFLRSRHKGTGAAVRAAIKSGQMQPALDAVNALQATPWSLNADMFDIIVQCYERGIAVPGLPTKAGVAKLGRSTDAEWEAMDASQRKLKKIRKEQIKQLSAAAKCDRVMFIADMTQARELAVVERFYTPMNCDWRGRVYSMSHFNFQREDRVRALFSFADGEPIGVEGLYWLKVHVANCGDFGKISKRPLAERAQWVEDNAAWITKNANDPLTFLNWTNADKPFLFLAACKELIAALATGPTFVTSIPVSFDGSCSGLQHLFAMTRAAEGPRVNLTHNELPQDIYATVAARVNEKLREALTETTESFEDKEVKAAARKREVAALALAFGIARDECKRGVMTFGYSSKKYGMAQQLQTDLMKPLEQAVLEGKYAEHPFAPYHQGSAERPSSAALMLAALIYDGIKAEAPSAAAAMKYLQKLATALAHEGKALRWTTPVGIPWINRYHDPITTRVELWLNDGGVRIRTQLTVAVGDKADTINKEASSNGVAPNFVHALDASHLLLVANAARARGITSIATVHDSFGCLPNRATEFNAVIREQFAEMYEKHDVLAEIMAQAKCDLTDDDSDRLPDAILPGPLNLKDIINAPFAFA